MSEKNIHQELLKRSYPDGYVVPEGEEGAFHIMFVKIIQHKGGRTTDKAVFQKFFPNEWVRMRSFIESPAGDVHITGYDEFVVLHDPIKYAEERRAERKRKADEAKKKAEAAAKAREARAAKGAASASKQPEPEAPQT